VFGVDAESLVGRSVNEFVVPDDEAAEREAAALDERLRAGEPVETRVTRRTTDGDREFRLRLAPLPDTSESLGIYDPVDESDGSDADGASDARPGTGADERDASPPGADAGG